MLHFQVKDKRSKIRNCQPPKFFLNSHCDVLPWESLTDCLTLLLLDPGSSIYYLRILLLSLVMTTYLLILFLEFTSTHWFKNQSLPRSIISVLLLGYLSQVLICW